MPPKYAAAVGRGRPAKGAMLVAPSPRRSRQAGAQAKRVSLFMRLLAKLPDTERSRRSRPWGGVCLMERA